MADLTSLAKESAKGLGAGAYLASILPSLLMVLIMFGLLSSSLYPWSTSQDVADGLPSIVASVKDLGIPGGTVLILIVLVLAALIRPFHIAAVQVLEGYWSSSRLVFLQQLGVERHRRRRSFAQWNPHPSLQLPDQRFRSNADYQRHQARSSRHDQTSRALQDLYPRAPEHMLPTTLGNILRRAETSAGERYGLASVLTYPRLYPHLSERLDAQISNQFGMLDATAAFFIVFAVSGTLSLPIMWRSDAWVLVPITFILAASVAYRGALRVAVMYGRLVHTAFDLHRFDMLAAMHRPLPLTPEQERQDNEELTEFLLAGDSGTDLPLLRGKYEHPQSPATQPGLTGGPDATEAPAPAEQDAGPG